VIKAQKMCQQHIPLQLSAFSIDSILVYGWCSALVAGRRTFLTSVVLVGVNCIIFVIKDMTYGLSLILDTI